ncbi:hypothetical protein ACH5RR_034991 [Cinchona calisaya]|uniref:Uncharacterized protein n=1 Tax=Cinchona calisaya TaxID=153742 RepID=A0ABD2YH00_9GENT
MLSSKNESSSSCDSDTDNNTQKQVELEFGCSDPSQLVSSSQKNSVDVSESIEEEPKEEKHSIAKDRSRREIRPPQRYANLVAYALSVIEETDGVGEPSTYFEAVSCDNSAKCWSL